MTQQNEVNIRKAQTGEGYFIDLKDGGIVAVTRRELEEIILYGGVILDNELLEEREK